MLILCEISMEIKNIRDGVVRLRTILEKMEK